VKALIKRGGKWLFAQAVRRRWFFILIPLFRIIINRLDTKNVSKGNTVAAPNGCVVLALHTDLFRGDLEILSNSGRLTILQVPTYWQWQLVDVFYPEEVKCRDTVEFDWYAGMRTNSPTLCAAQLQNFLDEFLTRLYSKLRVDRVLVPNVRHLCDFDWIASTRRLGIPVILLFRESLLLTKEEVSTVFYRHKRFGTLLCDKIIAHNERIADVFRKTNLIQADHIHVCGNLRMDQFADRIRESHVSTIRLSRQKVTLFYFPRNQRKFRSKEFEKIFDESLEVFITLARDNPEIDFLIKPKKEHLPKYKQPSNQPDLDALIEKLWPDFRRAENLFIDPFVDVHETILSSNVVCGFFSSVLLEAALAGKPIILPLFWEFLESRVGRNYPLRRYLHLFDVANDKAHYRHLIESRLKENTISESIQSERTNLFSTHISPVDGKTLARTVATITSSSSRTNIPVRDSSSQS